MDGIGLVIDVGAVRGGGVVGARGWGWGGGREWEGHGSAMYKNVGDTMWPTYTICMTGDNVVSSD
jgi:hypothetical protein